MSLLAQHYIQQGTPVQAKHMVEKYLQAHPSLRMFSQLMQVHIDEAEMGMVSKV